MTKIVDLHLVFDSEPSTAIIVIIIIIINIDLFRTMAAGETVKIIRNMRRQIAGRVVY